MDDKYILEPITFKYYRVFDDVERFPDAWAYIVVGGRNVGKTYGALDELLIKKIPYIFIKRTNEDVKLLCSKGKVKGQKVDVSPYKSINRDRGCNIQAFPIEKGLGGFYPTQDSEISGEMVGYLLSLYAAGKYKGSDFSECDFTVFDEFVPQPWERINRKEGEQLADLIKTVSRDRVLRGRPELKLLAFANAVNVYNPTCEFLGLTNDIAMMSQLQKVKDEDGNAQTCYMYDKQRKIFVRVLPTPEEMMNAEKNTGLFATLHETEWGRMAWGNEFAYNDFSCVKKLSLKKAKPLCSITHKNKTYYIYNTESGKYMCSSKFNQRTASYNLNRESEVKRFYYSEVMYFMDDVIEGRMFFEQYSMYDLIFNYKLRFKVT